MNTEVTNQTRTDRPQQGKAKKLTSKGNPQGQGGNSQPVLFLDAIKRDMGRRLGYDTIRARIKQYSRAPEVVADILEKIEFLPQSLCALAGQDMGELTELAFKLEPSYDNKVVLSAVPLFSFMPQNTHVSALLVLELMPSGRILRLSSLSYNLRYRPHLFEDLALRRREPAYKAEPAKTQGPDLGDLVGARVRGERTPRPEGQQFTPQQHKEARDSVRELQKAIKPMEEVQKPKVREMVVGALDLEARTLATNPHLRAAVVKLLEDAQLPEAAGLISEITLARLPSKKMLKKISDLLKESQQPASDMDYGNNMQLCVTDELGVVVVDNRIPPVYKPGDVVHEQPEVVQEMLNPVVVVVTESEAFGRLVDNFSGMSPDCKIEGSRSDSVAVLNQRGEVMNDNGQTVDVQATVVSSDVDDGFTVVEIGSAEAMAEPQA